MNFLAHIYLSGNEEDIILGNFIADGIKGNRYLNYPPGIAKGILLHRAIDTFTDAHPTVRKSTARLHQNYSHYSGVIVDIFYDHFLAKNWKSYCSVPLGQFAENFYTLLQKNSSQLPPRIQTMMPIMIANNWLVSYATVAGIGKILAQMNMRTGGVSKMDESVKELLEFYDEFESDFTSYFEELREFSRQKLLSL